MVAAISPAERVFLLVMAVPGLDLGISPAIHVLTLPRKGVDPRDKPGDDGGVLWVMAYR